MSTIAASAFGAPACEPIATGLTRLAGLPGAVDLSEVVRTLTLRAGHNTTVVTLGTTLLGLAAGLVGVFALLRKQSLTSDAIAHATLPGVTGAFIASAMVGEPTRSLAILLPAAAVSGVLGVLAIQAMVRWTRLHEDAAIGIVLSVFFGAGVVGLSYVQTNVPAGGAGLKGFLYGQTAAMRTYDAWLMAGIAAAAIGATALLLKEFALVAFNASFARVDGWPVGGLDLILLALVVVVTVAGLQAVGLILVIALLIIPAATARLWTERLRALVVLAGGFGALSGYLGATASAMLPRAPAGAVIVLSAGGFFALSLLVAPSRGVVATTWRRLQVRLRIESDHLVEVAYERPPHDGPDAARVTHRDLHDVARVRQWSWWFRPLVLAWMRRRGLLTRTGDGVALSPAGLDRGARVSRNHALWEQYLVSYADVAPSHVDWSVDQVEHVLSGSLVEELEAALARRGIDVRTVGARGAEAAPSASEEARP